MIITFRTLPVSFSPFHFISIVFHSVINDVIIRQHHCTNTQDILSITSAQAIHNSATSTPHY
jgi:hypothetical protein